MSSSCELPGGGAAEATSKLTAAGSRIHRLLAAGAPGDPIRWSGISTQAYKEPSAHHCGVLRQVLIGGSGEPAHFHLRYFEVAPGGHTSLEHHGHIHAVVALRGCGSVRLGEEVFPLSFGDVVYVAPGEVHQLRNDEGNEPFGFLCVVNAERDAPTLV